MFRLEGHWPYPVLCHRKHQAITSPETCQAVSVVCQICLTAVISIRIGQGKSPTPWHDMTQAGASVVESRTNPWEATHISPPRDLVIMNSYLVSGRTHRHEPNTDNLVGENAGHREVDTHGGPLTRTTPDVSTWAEPSATRSSGIPRPAARTRQRHHHRHHARQRADDAETAARPAPACDASARACGTSWRNSRYSSSRDAQLSNYAPMAFASCWGQ
ncbi:hypothetical protein LAUMK7_02910 [Mycobacterium kansasii]|uniref:Uncharacterized protein n=1 Tax=Mycobacterium persicum TaxID=1487726 RepID=A0AB38UT96_9MYCO|nr:hypothetical protein LAUMK7_02910 [Mycobacterium kansasii]VAZ83760.1 hypothetical protein LAUMK42_02578 [Mycobacterium persicum]